MSIALIAIAVDLGVAVYFAKRAKLSSVIEKVEEYLDNWHNAGGLDQYIWQEESGEWKCDERIGVAIDFIGSRLAHSLRQAMFQQMGVDAKLQKGVDRALSSDLLDQSGIGGFLDLVGLSHTKRMLTNNPKTLGLVLERIAPFLNRYLRKGPGANPGVEGYGWSP